MSPPPVICPICGAKVTNVRSTQDFNCSFCKFRRHPATSARINTVANMKNLHQLLNINDISTIYIDGEQIVPSGNHSVKLVALGKDHRKIDCIWSDMTLPFQEDLNEYFHEKFHQLAPGGLLYLSTPVEQLFHTPPPSARPNQFFQSKEHHVPAGTAWL